MEKWQELMLRTLGVQADLLVQIRDHLKAIRQATEQANEPGQGDEPSPFQSLSG